MTASIDLPPLSQPWPRVFLRTHVREKPPASPQGLDLRGQTGIVTGANSGIGLEFCRALLARNLTRVILAVRSAQKGEEAAASLRKKHPNATIEVWSLDMNSYDSVRTFADRCNTLDRIDFTMLNAGIHAKTFKINKSTGHEETIQVNYLSTSLLAILLLPVLQARHPPGKPAHLGITASNLSRVVKYPNGTDPLIPYFDKPAKWGLSESQDRYSISKLLLEMFLIKIKDFVNLNNVVVNLIEPGFIKNTGLQGDIPLLLKPIIGIMNMALARNTEDGAIAYLDGLLVKGKESHGCFLFNSEIYPFSTMLYEPSGQKATDKLWEETLNEFDFAGVREILTSLKASSN